MIDLADLREELDRLAKDLELENLQLSDRDRAAFAVERQKVANHAKQADADQRRQAQAERDEAAYDERMRRKYHHEVFARMIELFAQGLIDHYATREQAPPMEAMLGQVRLARTVADYAYPPPKQEQP